MPTKPGAVAHLIIKSAGLVNGGIIILIYS
jgi:hypothetical protein